jgi:uncharacterized membrane protein
MTRPLQASFHEAFELLLVRVILTGVWLSTAVLSTGLVLLLSRPPSQAGYRFLNVGLLILMSTPVVRLLLSVAEAIRERDWFWLSCTIAVVIVLSGTVAYSVWAR